MDVLRWAVSSVLAGAVVGGVLAWVTDDGCAAPPPPHAPRIGRVDTLRHGWERWAAAYAAAGGDHARVLNLGWSKALSARFVAARGQVRLDLPAGGVEAWVGGLQEDADLWVVDNRRGGDIRPEAGDRLVRLGHLVQDGAIARLHTTVGTALDGVDIDLVVVTAAGASPVEGALLVGNTTLFHRLWDAANRGAPHEGSGIARTAWPALFGPGDAHAEDSDTTVLTDLDALVAEGEDIFTAETFDGNGRTCATCHPPNHNYTIDPAYIARLPATDPLFVAETEPDLAADFEMPLAMRARGLILANADGFDDLANRFVLRGVPHTLALGLSVTAPPAFVDPEASDGPLERTGSSGDGAPGDGTLRDFATGAVTQHLPRTLGRVAGVDFRLPTDDELDATEAFLLSLGRDEDPDLATLSLRDPNAAEGLAVFRGDGRCDRCHTDGGGSMPAAPGGGNAHFDTGGEHLPDGVVVIPTSRGGLGRTIVQPNGGFGDGRFNVPSVVEAADTGPFFHDNAVPTLAGALDVHGSPSFQISSGSGFVGGIALSAEQSGEVVTFLRVLNVLENLRSAHDLASRAADAATRADARVSLRIAVAETDDALRVLRGGALHPVAVAELRRARTALLDARALADSTLRDTAIAEAQAQLALARAEIVVE
jgi:hypothetical protein